MELRIEDITKKYGTHLAVAGVSHRFTPGKITTIVGPSGSGKSTLLWMIAGLKKPDAGQVILNDQDITPHLPEHRNIGMVFQNYALFPHLTVAENVEFGLKTRKVPQSERKKRVDEVLNLVRIPHLASRGIRQISGGEQQRVALARALAIRPSVLLLDEPLSALDAKLREDVRAELFQLLNELAITTVYVTHDQIEAMSLGQELIVMNEGKIEQAGRPLDVYKKPESPFVATFLGSANIFEGDCEVHGDQFIITLPFGKLILDRPTARGACYVMIRPEDIEIAGKSPALFSGTVEESHFLGRRVRLHLQTHGHRILADVHNEITLKQKEPVDVFVRPEKVFIWPR